MTFTKIVLPLALAFYMSSFTPNEANHESNIGATLQQDTTRRPNRDKNRNKHNDGMKTKNRRTVSPTNIRGQGRDGADSSTRRKTYQDMDSMNRIPR